MTIKELKKILKDIPDGAEFVIDDDGCHAELPISENAE